LIEFLVPKLSLCIPAYNRARYLEPLLRSIFDQQYTNFEIIITEDCSPERDAITRAVEPFHYEFPGLIRYELNEENLGYDRTFCELVKRASGNWLVFMGDDDEFVPGAIDKVLSFLDKNAELGYVLKSHNLIHDDQIKERFRYFGNSKFFDAGVGTYVELFRKSVFIAGFTIRREYVVPYLTDRFDGTMLIQLYLMAEVSLKHPTAYFDEPFTQQYASHKHNQGDVMFDREKNIFVPRRPTLDISLNFLKSFSLITEYIDKKYNLNSTGLIKKDMSKYFYHSLSVHRDAGLPFFFNYVRELNKIGFNSSLYYYVYVILLTLLGKRTCDWGIRSIKKILGRTPRL
jgi:glycosyltransferase involved in cell wall biosynthesis